MKKILYASFLITLFSIASFAQNRPPTSVSEDEDVVKISTNLIQIDVSVTDDEGKQVIDLKPEDFEIYEDNRKREISNFSYVSVNKPTTDKNNSPAKIEPKQNKAEALKNTPPITNILRQSQVRRTIALVMDDLSISFAGNKFVKDALKRFVNEQMEPGDLVAIIRASGGSGVFQQFTGDKRLLLASIDKIKPNLTKVDSFAPLSIANSLALNKKYNALTDARYALGTLGAMNYVIKSMGQLPGRKTIILFSEGFRLQERPFSRNSGAGSNPNAGQNPDDPFALIPNLRSEGAARNTNSTSDAETGRIYSEIGSASKILTESANRAGIVINTIDARGLTEPSAEAADGTFEAGQNGSGFSSNAEAINNGVSDRRELLLETQSSLIYLAKETGGRAFLNNGFTTAIQKSIDDQNGYYLLGYQPDEETFDPNKRKFNKFEVRVKNRPTLKVRYRSGFFGVTDEKLPLKDVVSEKDAVLQAIFSPFDLNGIDLQLTPIFSNTGRADGNSVNALLHIKGEDLDFVREADGKRKGEFEIFAVTLDAGGKTIDKVAKSYSLNLTEENYQKLLAKGLVYMMNVPLRKSGAYQMKVAFRDTNNGKIGSSSQFLDIPNVSKGKLFLSGVLLQAFTPQELQLKMQRVSNSTQQSDSAAKIQNDTANRRFKRGTNLNFGYEIYGIKANSGRETRLRSQIKLFSENQILFESPKEIISVNGEKHKTESLITLGNDLKPGFYFLQISVTDEAEKDKNQSAVQWIDFEIID